jgi:tetratricopeptide (TPR) repeat protein
MLRSLLLKRAWLLMMLCCAIGAPQVHAQGTRWEHYMAEGVKAYQQGQEANAEKMYLAALADVEQAGPEDPRLAATLNTLAVLYHAQRKYAQAEAFYQRVLRLLEQTIGPEHPTLATTLNNLAIVYEAQEQYSAAEPLYQRALTLLERTLGPEHPNLAAALDNYADLLRKMQRPTEAETFEARAKAIWTKQKQPPAAK